MMRILATGVAGVALAGWASREALAQPGSTLPGTNASLPQCQIHGEWGNG
ncbi:hypothetical protein HUU62_00370 [Rhodoferax sp. 4810]|nr:hypothetical protein [Rhodoferax jenense]